MPGWASATRCRTRLCGPTTADEFVCVTDTTGGNHLLIGGTTAGASGAYEIQLS